LIGKGNTVVIKVARTNQNFFLDVPTIGIQTILALGQNGGGIIAIEQGKTFLIDRDKVVEKANELEVGVVGVSTSNS